MKQELIDMSIQTIKPKEDSVYFVYILHCDDLEGVYVGQTNDPRFRLRSHKNYNRCAGELKNWTMEILFECDSRYEAEVKELELIHKIQAQNSNLLLNQPRSNHILSIDGKEVNIRQIHIMMFKETKITYKQLRAFIYSRINENYSWKEIELFLKSSPKNLFKKTFIESLNMLKDT